MKKYIGISIVIIFLLFQKGYSQHCYGVNLIPNASLDSFSICPYNYCQIAYAVPWAQPLSQSTSDVLNQCMFSGAPTQFDTAYYRKTKWRTQGMAYLIVWDDGNWREYIEVPLKKQLEAGKCYYAEFYVLTHDVSYKVIDALGIYFSDTLVKVKSDSIIGPDTLFFVKPIYVVPQISNPIGRIIKDTVNWTKISGTFVANGTETAMIMGNFKYNSDINWEILNNWPVQSTRYFFDDFVVCSCDDTIPPEGPPNVVFIPNVFSPNGDAINDILYVRGEKVKEITFSIYNRWGELVFETQDINTGWDGTYRSKACDQAVYIYHARVVYDDGTEQEKKGNVSLVR